MTPHEKHMRALDARIEMWTKAALDAVRTATNKEDRQRLTIFLARLEEARALREIILRNATGKSR